MYLFTYAYNDKNANELFSEYHLGRKAFRICKRNTRYCAWHYEMPDLYIWRSACVTYDGYKDLYKLYIDGVKVESGQYCYCLKTVFSHKYLNTKQVHLIWI